MQGHEFSSFASAVKEGKLIAASEMRSAEWSPWCSARMLCTGRTSDDTEGCYVQVIQWRCYVQVSQNEGIDQRDNTYMDTHNVTTPCGPNELLWPYIVCEVQDFTATHAI